MFRLCIFQHVCAKYWNAAGLLTHHRMSFTMSFTETMLPDENVF